MDVLLTVAGFFLVLGPLVFVHELGHFLVSKLLGVHIEEFGLGFPPRLARLWRGTGRARIGIAEVRIPGNLRLPDKLEEGSSVRAVARRREQGDLVLQALELPGDDESQPGTQASPTPALAAGPDEVRLDGRVTHLQRGTEYTLNIIPLGGFVRPKGEDDPTVPGGLSAAPKRVRFAVLVAGAAMNFVAAYLLLTAAFLYGVPVYDTDRPTGVVIAQVVPGSPAETGGLLVNDVLVAVEGQPMLLVDEVRNAVDAFINAHPNEPINLTVRREDREVTLQVVPRLNPPEGQGKMGVALGQEYHAQLVQYGLVDALRGAAAEVANAVEVFVQVPAEVIRGLRSASDLRPVSPLGISQLGADVIRMSSDIGQWWPYLRFTALISIALAISNLLPLPALDGGRILFVLIEAIRGRRVAPERETLIHFVGMALLIMLMLALIVNDVLNPLSMP